MDSYERFHKLLKRDFSPVLRNEGFKGSGTNFRRIKDEVVHVLNIQGSRYGGQCCVNLGVHYSFLPTDGGSSLADLKKLKEYECAFRHRIRESQELDHWWTYGVTETESEVSVANLIDLYRRRGAAFFMKFEPFPDVFERITPAELDAGDLSKLPIEMSKLQAAITMARIMQHLRCTDKCRQFAEAGLRDLGHAVGLKSELERLRDAC
jgi:hypothetical protein